MADRAAHAHLPAAAVRQSDRSERARHAAVAIRSGVRRRRRGPIARPSLDPARTILGAEQEKWVFDNLADRPRAVDGAVPAGLFVRARLREDQSGRSLLDGRLGRLSGGAPAALLAAQGDEGAQPDRAVRRRARPLRRRPEAGLHRPASRTSIGIEFTNTSISAGGDGAEVVRQLGSLRGDNPHIRYHSARRGYIACTATPATMRADFKILDRVTRAGSARSGSADRWSSKRRRRRRREARAMTLRQRPCASDAH